MHSIWAIAHLQAMTTPFISLSTLPHSSKSRLRLPCSHSPSRPRYKQPRARPRMSTEVNGREVRPVVVASSLNVDVSIGLERAPEGGETVLGESVVKTLGGKGANTAVAAARAQSSDSRGVVYLAATVGQDADGNLFREEVRDCGVDVSLTLGVSEAPTGSAYIVVDARGENRIIVVPGANAEFGRLTDDARFWDALRNAVVVLHLEIPPEVVLQIATHASSLGATVVLNPSPVSGLREIREQLLPCVHYMVVNHLEAAQIAELHRDVGECAQSLAGELAVGGGVVVTQGDDAVLVARSGCDVASVQAAKARKVVDTTGAGDTLTGYLAAGLARGESVVQALERAVVAAAMAVETRGAARAIPSNAAVRRRMNG